MDKKFVYFLCNALIKFLGSIKSMLVIVDNGKGAGEISRFLRMPNNVVKPSQLDGMKARAYILSDGSMSNQKVNEKLVQKSASPILGVGAGCMFVGTSFGAKMKSVPKVERQERLMIKKPCPLTLDLKRMFTVHESYQHVFSEVPENFGIAASSQKYEYEIIQEMSHPFFGVQFLPEKGGDGLRILDNFVKFVEIWERYHK